MNKFYRTLLVVLIFAAGFAVRLYKIDNPVADWHSWRQADTAAVTRNYVRLGVDLLHPRFDDFSDLSGNGFFNPQGYRFVEFPIFNLLHYGLYHLDKFIPDVSVAKIDSKWAMPINTVLSLLFDAKSLEVLGRLTSILAALTSARLLIVIGKRHWGTAVGVLAAFFYLMLPFNIYFTRVILPDPLMVTLFLASLNFFDLKRRWLGVIFGSLAIAVKPIAAFLLLPAFISNFWLSTLMLIPFGAWRAWSHLYPEGIPASNWLFNGNGIRFKGAFFQWLFGVRIGQLILGKWGIWAFMTGVVKANRYLAWWILGALAYMFTMATGNVQHDYYQIPIIPVISLVLALGTVRLWEGHGLIVRGLVVMCTVFMLAFGWYDIRGNFQVNNGAMLRAADAVDKIVPQDALIVATYNGDTAFLYNTKRRGFTHLPLPIKDLKDRYGIMYYVSTSYDTDTRRIMDQYIAIEEKPEYVIVKLEERPDYWIRKNQGLIP